MHTLEEIIDGLSQVFEEMKTFTEGSSAEQLEKRTNPEKWSAGGNLEHLILSTKPLAKAMGLPKIAFKAFGKPNRPGRDYPELVKRYKEKLATNTAIAPSGYQPKAEKPWDKTELLLQWQKEGDKLIKNLQKWKDADLDAYLLPHPLLGKLTIREMLFFTHYHTLHHLAIMKERI